jgi:hypothetical protein
LTVTCAAAPLRCTTRSCALSDVLGRVGQAVAVEEPADEGGHREPGVVDRQRQREGARGAPSGLARSKVTARLAAHVPAVAGVEAPADTAPPDSLGGMIWFSNSMQEAATSG